MHSGRKEESQTFRILEKGEEMEKQVDEEFNIIVLKNILPLISQAFSSLNAEANFHGLTDVSQDARKKIIVRKADQMKRLLNSYIDRQSTSFVNLYQANESQ